MTEVNPPQPAGLQSVRRVTQLRLPLHVPGPDWQTQEPHANDLRPIGLTLANASQAQLGDVTPAQRREVVTQARSNGTPTAATITQGAATDKQPKDVAVWGATAATVDLALAWHDGESSLTYPSGKRVCSSQWSLIRNAIQTFAAQRAMSAPFDQHMQTALRLQRSLATNMLHWLEDRRTVRQLAVDLIAALDALDAPAPAGTDPLNRK